MGRPPWPSSGSTKDELLPTGSILLVLLVCSDRSVGAAARPPPPSASLFFPVQISLPYGLIFSCVGVQSPSSTMSSGERSPSRTSGETICVPDCRRRRGVEGGEPRSGSLSPTPTTSSPPNPATSASMAAVAGDLSLLARATVGSPCSDLPEEMGPAEE
ncbi:hypothetical protein BRADI_1g10605v3 [Brachypodium distachyon]|uniref:Uncharacterized protein n=1 Tax=Brachypodium distachyon TaxID=15368 RepID=A0A2K2DIY0_BRADI|nr:hypothetical protein BRADI_1g10605v3 [Brachypodium distachyon]